MINNKKGFFITFEGGEGAGKSTQIKMLHEYLSKEGISSILTREPGGTKGGEAIRELLLTGEGDKWDPVSEVLLFSAARREHILKEIFPALSRGQWVLCDRFSDSTVAYQGYAYGSKSVSLEEIDILYRISVGNFYPDLTIVLDIPVEEGLSRVKGRNEAINRFEAKEIEFYEKLRSAYISISKSNPDRCVLIDALRSKEEINSEIISLVKRRFC